MAGRYTYTIKNKDTGEILQTGVSGDDSHNTANLYVPKNTPLIVEVEDNGDEFNEPDTLIAEPNEIVAGTSDAVVEFTMYENRKITVSTING